jgi:hypothetical protein
VVGAARLGSEDGVRRFCGLSDGLEGVVIAALNRRQRPRCRRAHFESALGATRPDSDSGRGVRRPDYSPGSGLGFDPDDTVPDVVELRCAGRCGPGRGEALRVRSSRSRGGCLGVIRCCRCDGVLRRQTSVGGNSANRQIGERRQQGARRDGPGTDREADRGCHPVVAAMDPG